MSSFISLKANILFALANCYTEIFMRTVPFPFGFLHLLFERCTNVIMGSSESVLAVSVLSLMVIITVGSMWEAQS